ncbi:hypothetical protein C7U89_22365 [Bradyrhizobium sp. WBOS4]|nr:hypothetical protein [Bradyrhizobium sp. WBOS8]MDD1585661.1 hypothetical protein [Bradyrhizobium sp. WBOS4]UUO49053.1 hypothetical protein DCM78_20335 [Bradyrhizobium sp. WBOS04]UUO62868.1 hypothetical protein DCM80_29210 [Bradyrhizobium sp. WBOS08]
MQSRTRLFQPRLLTSQFLDLFEPIEYAPFRVQLPDSERAALSVFKLSERVDVTPQYGRCFFSRNELTELRDLFGPIWTTSNNGASSLIGLRHGVQ